ncbi:hypothetical protein FXO38_32219 [Capsicum annuum]|nr:hypothetical protein FXO38_32219 [Capsicum annuum]KAF3666978.1 hypothetical protein FXO37_10256 [Capsicum annuum]
MARLLDRQTTSSSSLLYFLVTDSSMVLLGTDGPSGFMEQLVGRFDNSAVLATGSKLAFKSNEEIGVQIKTIPLDEVIQETERVLLIKRDVQGWEYHVLKGASNILSRKKGEAPYLIYDKDERLLQARNSSAKSFLFSSLYFYFVNWLTGSGTF